MSRKQTIKVHNSTNENTTPSLSKGEIAVNIPDQKLYVGNTANNAINISPNLNFISSTRYDSSTTGITSPSQAIIIEIIGCGGGGGGASGVSSYTTTAGGAGRGGQGGQGGRLVFRLDDLGITAGITELGITIGNGGTGGASVQMPATNNFTNGITGTDGQSTFVYIVANNKLIVEFPGGQGGQPTSTTASKLYRNMRSSFDGTLTGCGGQGAQINSGTVSELRNSTPGGNALYGGGGGGGGGHVRSDATRGRIDASAGGSSNVWYIFPNVTYSGGMPGISSTTEFNGYPGITTEYGGGGGGGGVGLKVEFDNFGFTAGAGGTGATGGGAGGGGGQAGTTATSGPNTSYWSGKGGNGGKGYVILRWW